MENKVDRLIKGNVDLLEWYFEQGLTDGLPVTPPTPKKVEAMIQALGGKPDYLECRVPPRWGILTRKVLAINAVMSGCKPEYACILRAAMVAMSEPRFNLAALQASTHMVSPLVIVNGPLGQEVGMNCGCNCFGSGNRANATIGRAIRLIMLNVGGGRPGELDKSTLGNPTKYSYCIAENEEMSPWAPYHVEQGYSKEKSTVFVLAAEAPHSVTNHISTDPEGILESVCSAMSTIAHNNAVMGGACAVVLGPEHAATIAGRNWTRNDIKSYLWTNTKNTFGDITFHERYGKIYNRHLPKWFRRENEAWTPTVSSPNDIHLFVAGGDAGRFSAFIPGWGNVNQPVLRAIDGTPPASGNNCVNGTCLL